MSDLERLWGWSVPISNSFHLDIYEHLHQLGTGWVGHDEWASRCLKRGQRRLNTQRRWERYKAKLTQQGVPHEKRATRSEVGGNVVEVRLTEAARQWVDRYDARRAFPAALAAFQLAYLRWKKAVRRLARADVAFAANPSAHRAVEFHDRADEAEQRARAQVEAAADEAGDLFARSEARWPQCRRGVFCPSIRDRTFAAIARLRSLRRDDRREQQRPGVLDDLVIAVDSRQLSIFGEVA